jgi:hypothetical protein
MFDRNVYIFQKNGNNHLSWVLGIESVNKIIEEKK